MCLDVCECPCVLFPFPSFLDPILASVCVCVVTDLPLQTSWPSQKATSDHSGNCTSMWKSRSGRFYYTLTQLEVEAQGPRSPVETGICELSNSKWKAAIVWRSQISSCGQGLNIFTVNKCVHCWQNWQSVWVSTPLT